MKTFAIIPALNEHAHLPGVVERTLRFVDEVVVVDDGSSRPLAKSLPNHEHLTVLRHRINLGKGAALTTGIEYAARHGANAVVLIDADGQHDPDEIPRLLEPLQNNTADIVFGVRTFHTTMPAMAKLGNVFLTTMLTGLFGIKVSDTQSGYRAFLTSVFPKLRWRSPRYAVETEMIVNAGKYHLRSREVPITTIYLDSYKGTTVLDGIRIFLNMIMWRFL